MKLNELIKMYEERMDQKRMVLADNLLGEDRSKSEIELLILEHDLYTLEDVVADLRKVKG